MATTKPVNCPHCGRKLGSYPIDMPTTQRTSGTCNCGKRYTIEYGQNKIKVSKG